MRPLHSFPGVSLIARIGRTFVEGHHNVSAELSLDLHYRDWGKCVARSVDVGLKLYPIGADAAEAREAEYLEAAAIREHGAIPARSEERRVGKEGRSRW